MTNIRRIIAAAVALTVIAAIGGCAKTAQVEATGKSMVRGINSIVTSPELIFLIEELSLGSIAYKDAVGFVEYDDLSYNFNFDIFPPDSATTIRLATEFIDVVADTEYTVVLTGTIANPAIFSWEAPERIFDAAETVFEADFAHLSPTLGEVDVYFVPENTAPMLGDAIGTLNYGERIPYQEFADGRFELIITLKDDPLNFLYQSLPLSSTPATRVTFSIFDPDPSITADIAVNLINPNGGSASLPDVNTPANVRLLHAAFGTVNVNGYFNNDLNTIIFPNVGLGGISSYTDIDTVLTPFTVTDATNSAATVHEEEIIIGSNSKSTIILGGEPGSLLYRELRDEARPLESFPVVRITNMSINANVIDIYMLPPGTVIAEETATQFSGLPSLVDTGFFGPAEGTHEITVTLFGEITPISVPVTIDVVNGDIVDIAILDTVDPAMVDLFIFDSTALP